MCNVQRVCLEPNNLIEKKIDSRPYSYQPKGKVSCYSATIWLIGDIFCLSSGGDLEHIHQMWLFWELRFESQILKLDSGSNKRMFNI